MTILVVLGGGLGLLLLLALAFRRPEWCLYLAIALSGVLLTPVLPLVGRRLVAADAAFLAAGLGLVVQGLRARGSVGVSPRVAGLYWLIGAVLFLYTASYLANTVLGNLNVSGSTLELLNYVYGALIVGIIVLMSRDWATWRGCMNAWACGALLVTLFALLAVAGWAPEWAYHTGGARVTSTLRRPNQLASYVIPALPIVAWIALDLGRSRLLRLGAAMTGIGIVAAAFSTGSRTAVAMCMVAIVGLIAVSMQNRDSRSLALRAAVLAGVVTLPFVYLGVAVWSEGQSAVSLPGGRGFARPILLTQQALSSAAPPESRELQWSTVATHWDEHLLLGVGPDNFGVVFGLSHEVHNTYLGLLIEAGLPALVLFLTLMTALVWQGWWASGRVPRRCDRGLFRVAVLGFVLLLMYGLGSYGLRQRPFWIGTELLMAGLNLSAELRRRDPR